jgi:EVE domain
MAQDYLLKTEPSEYSFADLQRDKVTVWDGVSNPVALKNLRAMEPGVRLVIYETGDHKSAVGTASVVSVDAADPRNPAVKIKAGKAITRPVSPGGDQGRQAVRRLAAGASRTALRRAANGSAT